MKPYLAFALGLAAGHHLAHHAQVLRQRSELRRRIAAMGGSGITTRDDGGQW